MIVSNRNFESCRRGSMAVEHVMAAAVLMTAAAIVMRFGFIFLWLLHHLISTLVGWPTL